MLITQQPQEIVTAFKNGDVFAYPTEAVYGLGCDPDKKMSVLRLLYIKNRLLKKGLILIASDFSQVEKYLKPLSQAQLAFTAPSDTTYLFPSLDTAPIWLTGGFDSLGIRISKHPLVRELCSSLGSALVSTSANLSGQTPARTSAEVEQQLGQRIDVILEGKLGDSQKPSEIRDSISGQLIRA